MKNQAQKKSLYLTFYIAGVVFGLALTLAATWADLEAAFYGFDHTGGDRMNTLQCPILMGADETGSFSVEITNTTDRSLSPTIKTDVSTARAPVSTYNPIKLEAGETRRLEWTIGPENVDLGRFILVRAWMYAAYPIKDKENTCGVMVLPLPGSGMVYTWGVVALSLLGMGGGLFLLRKAQSPERGGMDLSRMGALAVIVIAGLVISFMGNWLAGVLVLVLSLLISVISIGYAFKPSRPE
ncbi:MAG: hypothetical protein DPW18_05820 [Chloroflexi bacterium]|nr:hypothetical protein [Chloroflexota bacterium]MDL1942223.1 hypothetical protein [Chloroflexi bacterium CFX2]